MVDRWSPMGSLGGGTAVDAVPPFSSVTVTDWDGMDMNTMNQSAAVTGWWMFHVEHVYKRFGV